MPKYKKVIKVGDTFGDWTILSQAETRKLNEYFLCECACNNTREVFRGSLISGQSKGCGCRAIGQRRESPPPPDIVIAEAHISTTDPAKVKVGSKFYNWTVKRCLQIKGVKYANCECTCGDVRDVYIPSLTNRLSRSCGCLKRVRADKQNRQAYYMWLAFKDRCFNTNSKFYYRYGGKGILMHEAWESFDDFVQDVKDAPSSHHILMRIDTTGDFEPGNVHWVLKGDKNLI